MRPAIGFTSRRRQRRHRVVERTQRTISHRDTQTQRKANTENAAHAEKTPIGLAAKPRRSVSLRLNFLCVLGILCVAQDQNTSRSANCITRGSPASLVIVATAALLMFDSGRPNSSALKRLNTSQRSSTAV